MQIVETIKQHKLLAAGTAIAAVLVVLAMRSAGAGGSVANAVTGDVATGDAVAAAQLQSQHDIALANIQAGAAGAHDAASLSLAQIQADIEKSANELAANVGLAQINASLQANTTHDTLAAQVAENQINAGVQTTAITSNAATAQMQAITQALVKQSQIQASVATAAIENQCHGFGCLF